MQPIPSPETSPLPLGDDAFRRVVEWAPSAMVLIDGNGIILLVNAQTEKMFGYERGALIGKSVEMLVPERFRHHHRTFRAGYFGDPQPRPMGAGRAPCRRRRVPDRDRAESDPG